MKQSVETFIRELVAAPDDMCIPWPRALGRAGYGQTKIGGRQGQQVRVHRYVWTITRGSIPQDICVLHHCDNPGCINPKHLFLGTRKDNYHDAAQKGRVALGERHGRAKLSTVDVQRIREVWPQQTQRELARRYGVAFQTISKIVRRVKWAHL